MSRTTDHIDAFNLVVTSGDWDTFSERFATDARMSFVGVPAGPFEGRTTIAQAYRENPPTETMTLEGPDGDTVKFRWSGGDAGTMHLTWAPGGAVQALTVSFN